MSAAVYVLILITRDSCQLINVACFRRSAPRDQCVCRQEQLRPCDVSAGGNASGGGCRHDPFKLCFSASSHLDTSVNVA